MDADNGDTISLSTPSGNSGIIYNVASTNDYARLDLVNVPSAVSKKFTILYSGVGVELVNGTTAFAAVSDKRYKRDVVMRDNSVLDKFDDINTYNYKLKKDKMNINHIGVMADEIYKHFPECCSITEREDPDDENKKLDDVIVIRYSELVVPLIQAVKELTARVRELEKK